MNDDPNDLLGAYALGACDDDERRAVEAYLLDHPDARAELHELEHATAWLGHASLRPAPEVWESIRAVVDADLAAAAAPTGNVTAIAAGRAPRPRRTHVFASIGAVAAAVALVVAVGLVARDGGDAQDDYRAAITAPGAQTVSLTGSETDGSVDIVVLPGGRAYVGDGSLDTLPSSQTYQLWALDDDGTATSLGTLGSSVSERQVEIAPSATLLAITAEPAGGSPMPTGTPIVAAPVTV